MAAMSAGGKTRSFKVVKGGTESTRKHRFQSFNQRISKLEIDPVHKSRTVDLDPDATTSHFQNALIRWKDLNISADFAEFLREVQPLCQSLPQILHYQEQIMGALVRYIEKRNALSLESLLDLLASFAHDLGARFECYFATALRLVASLAATHPTVEVIEWSFECLAWLFKYLSRLLVSDLRPVFQIMAPLLGREPQKTHITRFAAEALSFLVRKAASIYHKNPRALDSIVEHILEDFRSVEVSNATYELYQQGLMTLFVDSIKGIDRKLHPTGSHIYSCLLDHTLKSVGEQPRAGEDIIYGTTVGIIHHTDADGFQPILTDLFERIKKLNLGSKDAAVGTSARLLLLALSVRKGSRILDWTPVLDASISLLELCDISSHKSATGIYNVAAVALALSPLEDAIAKLRLAMGIITQRRHSRHFLAFCNDLSSLNGDRFHSLVFSYYNKWVSNNWREHELQLYLAIPRIVREGESKVSCPEPLQEHIVSKFSGLTGNNDSNALCNAFLAAMDCLAINSSTVDAITTYLKSRIEEDLASSLDNDATTMFGLGTGLRSYAQLEAAGEHTSQLWFAVYGVAAKFGTLPPYLEAVLYSLKSIKLPAVTDSLHPLIETTTENLHSSSHVLRRLSLQILETLHVHIYDQHADILITALTIEDNPLTLQTARSASMHARKLSVQYSAIAQDNWLLTAIPHFCFGLLTFKLSQLGNDAIDVLKTISSRRVGEDTISSLAFRWLEDLSPPGELPHSTNDAQGNRKALTPFQCLKLSEVENMMSSHANEMEEASSVILKRFQADHHMTSQTPVDAPSLALRILMGTPHIAEKRSRQLVPIFLRWAADKSENRPVATRSDEDATDDFDEPDDSQRLARKDRKVMLDLFGRFVNPRVLYRASEVHKALLGLLASGDVAIQKSALQALLTWKSPSLTTYQENLNNLLDDVRFREEIAIFVNVDKPDSAIQDEHCRNIMPVLLRILYGKIVARSGPTGRRGQSIKRKAVLEALTRFDRQDLEDFINIALGPLANVVVINDMCELDSNIIYHEYLDARKQVGLMTMIKDLLETMGDRLAPFTRTITNALLYCSIKASRGLNDSQQDTMLDESEHSQTSILKSIRQKGLQSLTLLFRYCSLKDHNSYLPVIFSELINPRMERLPIETSQSVSGLLQLFSVWASSHTTITLFSNYNPTILRSITSCLGVESAKDDVKLYVLQDILQNIVVSSSASSIQEHRHLEDSEDVATIVLRPHMDFILSSIGSHLRKSPSKELLGSAIHLIATLAPLVGGSAETKSLLEISSFLLDQPSNRVNPNSKGDLLKILEHFMPLLDAQTVKDLHNRIFGTVSSLFGFFRDRANRELLSRVLNVLAAQDRDLQLVTTLCRDLNAFSPQKVDEPNFELRLKAFSSINETQYTLFSAKQWRPILFNMLFYIKDQDELAIRSNASLTLQRFIEVFGGIKTRNDDAAFGMLKSVLLPALRLGVLDHSELVRSEYLNVMAQLIRCNPEWEEVNDMCALLCDDDEEASFFSNVLHIQQHRRLRALRRLASEARKSTLNSGNVAHCFIPLVEHFIFDKADDESAHNLSAEAATTIGALAQSLEWPQFRAMFRRFTGYIQSKPDIEKTIIKLLGLIIDALVEAAPKQEAYPPQDKMNGSVSLPQPADKVTCKLAATLPKQEKLTEDLVKNHLPSLVKYLHDKDESTVSLRVPVAISIVKLLQLLPERMLNNHLPPILTDVCNILRSRAQDSRDLTRKTLVEISTLIGPRCFGFILRELRSSLSRGYQLHVLSFTVHSILVATASIFKPGELDYCLPQLVSVIMDDIFGVTGQEKDAEEYISKMKEVRSSKSYDSMELIAKVTSIDSFVNLIRPIQDLLHERLDLKMVKKIDELLRRLGVGLLRNEKINDRRVLVFCHEIIRETYKTGGEDRKGKEDPRMKRFLINTKGATKYGNRGSTSSYNYKVARFSLDLLRSVLHKYDSLETPSNIQGFIPIIGDSIVQTNEEIQISALRLLATIIKVPLEDIDENAGIYISESVKIVKNAATMSSELAQAALKLVSAVLRERIRIVIKENDLAYLLRRLIPDLDEPDRQGVAFNFLKAVLTRKVMITEVYEVIDVVAAMMVRNQTKGTRDVARSIYFQFIQDYPQTKGRFAKQMGILAGGLTYEYQEGRQAVMEAIHLFLSKIGDNLVQDILSTFFLPLVLAMVNDDSAECREMAGTLVKTILEKADPERKQAFLNDLRPWLNQFDDSLRLRAALQVYCIFLDSAATKGERELSTLQSRLLEIFKQSVQGSAEVDWEVLYFALQAFLKICHSCPDMAFSAANTSTWVSVRKCLAFPHAWVKNSSAKLLGALFADFARTNAGKENATLPLKGSGGLYLTAHEMTEIARMSLRSLRVANLNEELVSQSIRNLVFLGKNLGDTPLNELPEQSAEPDLDAEDDDDSSEEERSTAQSRKTAVQFIFERASAIIRRGPATTKAPALTPMRGALQLMGALCNHLPAPALSPSIQTILLPLHNLSDPSIPPPSSSDESFNASYKALVASSMEIVSLLQKKLGTTEYIANLAKVREGVKARREGRRVKRRIEAVAQPERAGALKKRKGEKKKEKRKEKSGEERGRRRGW